MFRQKSSDDAANQHLVCIYSTGKLRYQTRDRGSYHRSEGTLESVPDLRTIMEAHGEDRAVALALGMLREHHRDAVRRDD